MFLVPVGDEPLTMLTFTSFSENFRSSGIEALRHFPMTKNIQFKRVSCLKNEKKVATSKAFKVYISS